MRTNIEDLNNLQIDVLRDVGNIGAGNDATALAKILNKKIDMAIPEIKVLEFNQVNEILGGEEIIVVGLLLRIMGDLNGDIMFIIERNAAHTLVNMLLGNPIDDHREFNEMSISALKEIGNILAGSYITALSSLTNLRILPSVPVMAIDMAGAIISVPAIQFGRVGDKVLYIETVFSEGRNKVMGDFFLIPDIESFDVLLKALGVSD
jgi:chemotaxis protein CheC